MLLVAVFVSMLPSFLQWGLGLFGVMALLFGFLPDLIRVLIRWPSLTVNAAGLVDTSLAHLFGFGLIPWDNARFKGLDSSDQALLEGVIVAQRERAKTLKEMAQNSRFFFVEQVAIESQGGRQASQRRRAGPFGEGARAAGSARRLGTLRSTRR